MSRISRTAPETDNAAANRLAMAVALRGANSPKLKKTTISQKTMMAIKTLDTEKLNCWYISQRVLAMFTVRLIACACSGFGVIRPGRCDE